jgi:hypothetical protein
VTRIALIPGCLALLPEYRSLGDPVAELRGAVSTATGWLGGQVEIVGSAQGGRVAAAALASRAEHGEAERSILVTLNGSASRTEKAPGYFDPRAEPFDADLRAALTTADADALRGIDAALGAELGADLAALAELADLVAGAELVSVDFDEAPFGVQYWVLRWQS